MLTQKDVMNLQTDVSVLELINQTKEYENYKLDSFKTNQWIVTDLVQDLGGTSLFILQPLETNGYDVGYSNLHGIALRFDEISLLFSLTTND